MGVVITIRYSDSQAHTHEMTMGDCEVLVLDVDDAADAA